jgi:hypothetical protein
MRRRVERIVVLVGVLALSRPADAQDRPATGATPAEQYQELMKACEVGSPGKVLTDEERMQFVGHAYKVRNEVALRLVELAEKHPTDPIAREALTQAVWQVNTTPWPVELVGRNDAIGRAFEQLQRDHLQSDQLGPLCQRISWGFCKEYETFLRAVVKSNSCPEVNAVAVVSLAHYLNHRSQRMELLKEQPESARQFEELFGREYVDDLMRLDADRFTPEADALLEQVAKEHGDVRLPDGATIGERARSELFDLRNLRVGKAAPEIEGVDQDGVPFKLSGERGKVVLLDFWSFV